MTYYIYFITFATINTTVT